MSVQPIRRDTVLRLDCHRAEDALRSYALERGNFAVQPSCTLPGLDTEILLARDVLIMLRPSNTLGSDGSYLVHWQPADLGRFPRFDGTLRVVSDGELTHLQLDGSYDDPAGARADAVEIELGVRFAEATARAMLEEIVSVVTG
jgi:hypothetical protein